MTLLATGCRSSFTLLTKLTFGEKYCAFDELMFKKCIRMGITVFKIVIWGGISSVI